MESTAATPGADATTGQWLNRYRQLVDHLPHAAILMFDAGLRLQVALGGVFEEPEYQGIAVPGAPLTATIAASLWDDLEWRYLAVLAGEESDYDHVSPLTGRVFRTRLRPIREGELVVGGLAITEDVHAEREALDRARAAEREASTAHAFSSAVLAASPDIVSIVDVMTNGVAWTSKSLEGVLGYSGEELIAMGAEMLARLVPEEDAVRLRAVNLAVQDLPDGEAIQLRYRVRDSIGNLRWMARRVTPFRRDEHGAVYQALAVTREVTDVVVAEEQLRHSALHDPLTELPNRALLADRLSGALARAARDGTEVALLFCDLDGFKRVNDTGGHVAGDKVLVEIADRLRTLLRDGDTVARVGGDEFVVVMEPNPLVPRQRRDAAAGAPAALDARGTAVALADRIRSAVGRPVSVDGTEHVVSVSIGITLSRPGSAADDMLRDSDTAMYRAKERGKNRHEVFDEGLRAHVLERDRVERVLRAALSGLVGVTARFSVAYQPVVELRSGRLVAVEALARLEDAFGAPISPDVFIDVAEDTGLIHELGRVVLSTALRDLAHWRTLPGGADLTVAVNMSARQAQQADVSSLVRSSLAAHGLPASALTLELTESVLLSAGPSTLRQMTELHDHGVAIAIDDFGTGYASLRYLATLPVSQVKIDRSFVAGLPGDPTSVTIVRAVAGLARDLGLECVAEGIETEEQRMALPFGVQGQGWLLGRPMTAEALEGRLGTVVRR